MPEMAIASGDGVEQLRERVRKLSRDKSHLQMINSLMNKVSAAQGLNNMVSVLLGNILDVIGGTNIILYYLIDGQMFSADVIGSQSHVDVIDDEVVRKAFEFRVPIEVENDFGDTRMLTREFSKAYTLVFPLLAGPELIGLIKLENLHISMRELYDNQPAFFPYVANVLKNELQSRSRLKIANDQLRELNEQLQSEVMEREQVEEELRQARDELEERIRERTAELQRTNERLQQEIDEHLRTQEALRAYADEVQDLYNRAPCGYHSLDDDGLIIRINDTELQWLGYEREEIAGRKRLVDLLTPLSRQTFRENFPLFLAQGWIRDLEFELVRKDGSILPVLVSATAIYDGEGRYLMSRSTAYDLSGRVKALEQEYLLGAIIQGSDDAIFAKDLQGRILSWNEGAERMYGYSAGEAVGQPVSLLIPPGGEDELAGIMAAIRRGDRIEHYSTTRKCKDGGVITVSLTVSPLRNRGGAIAGASIIARDITEQTRTAEEIGRLNQELEARVTARTNDLDVKRVELEEIQRALMNLVEDLSLKTAELEVANDKLLELDRLKSLFIASMSHELRTPLNSIIGFSSILHDEWLGPVNQEQKENLATILRSGKHLLSLINDVIDVSKIEAGKLDVRLEEFEAGEVLEEAARYVEKDVSERGLELQLDIRPCTVVSDRRRLLQCVINLLTNAVKFTECGTIVLQCSTDGNGVRIAVSDTGIGIAAGDIPRLFLPFVRLESVLKIVVPGTGLGLYLTRKLVEEVLGGDIVCFSVPGAGSTFTIHIPERYHEKSSGS